MKRLSTVARSVVILAAVAAASALVAIDVDLWKPASWVTLAFIVVMALTAISEQGWALWRNARQRRREEFEQAAGEALRRAVLEVARAGSQDVAVVGVKAFRITRRWRRAERLERVGQFRLTDHPQSSSVEWTAGKGLIGHCWQAGRPVHRDLRSVARRHGEGKVTEAAFGKLSSEARMGLSFEEYRTMVGKYAEVLATPIKDDQGATVGVLAVDVPFDGCHANAAGGLSVVGVEEVAAATAKVVFKLLERR